jgi:hypothetical protein
MNNELINLGILHPAPNTSAARRKTDWSQMDNDSLKFSLDLLSLHHSPFEVDCMNEIQNRIMAGTWLDLEKPPPLQGSSVPRWLHIFPFSLLWRQKRGF